MLIVLIVISLLAAIVLISQWTAHTPAITGADGKPLPGSIAALEKVKLGGVDQWLIIRGHDVNKPVLLFLVVYPQLQEMDFRVDATRLDLPVYIVLGRHDMNNPSRIPEEYFNLLEAPSKQLVFFENSGHGMIWEEAGKFHHLMVETVLPETHR